ncbi:MAG: nitronate monooxygenase [Deltaproteobacteria bacterium]|nr:nitronate monooxygenase [Deltaproteobacteria bacterium]
MKSFTEQVGIEVPLICGAMYPCSNPELVAAVSEAGGIGIVQPLSMVFVHRHDFRGGLQLIKRLTKKPIGMNIIVEKSSKIYEDRMKKWLDVSLEEGVRFFVTSLGNPRWVCERAHASGALVYHDVTTRKWAEKALEGGVDGLIAVNNRAGGHAGGLGAEQLFADLSGLGVPLIAAGGVGAPEEFRAMLDLGYAAVQLGTRFIATPECRAHQTYKDAIVKAEERDIVLTKRITGVPVSVIRTPYIDQVGTEAGLIARMLLRNNRTKHWVRMAYSIQSMIKLRRSSLKGMSYQDYWQAGKSVHGIEAIEPAGDIVRKFAAALAPGAAKVAR